MNYGPILIFFAAMLWATDSYFRSHLTGELPSTFIVLAEHAVDVVIVLPLLIAAGWSSIQKLTPRQWGALLVIGVGGSAAATVAFTQSFHYVSPSVAVVLQKLQPLVAITLAAVVLKESFGRRFWLWAGAALLGAYFVTFAGFTPQLYPGAPMQLQLHGAILALVAAVLWATSTVMGRYLLGGVDFKLVTSLRFVVAFVTLLVTAYSTHAVPVLSSVSGKNWLFIAITAVTSGVVSLFIYYYGMRTTKASVASLAELGFPVAAVIIVLLTIPGSTFNAFQIAGTAMLLGSIYMLTKREPGKNTE